MRIGTLSNLYESSSYGQCCRFTEWGVSSEHGSAIIELVGVAAGWAAPRWTRGRGRGASDRTERVLFWWCWRWRLEDDQCWRALGEHLGRISDDICRRGAGRLRVGAERHLRGHWRDQYSQQRLAR